MRAKNATLQSGGRLKSITVDSGKKLLHRGSAKTITTEAEGLDVTLDAGSRTDALIVNGDDSNIAMNGNSTVDAVNVEGEDATLHIAEGSDVDNVGIAGIEKVFDGALRESTNPSSRWITKKYK